MSHEDAAEFATAANTLAAITCEPKWGDLDMADAKPIGLQQWRATTVIAAIVAKECSWIPWPVPGADPEGFTWLTWSDRERSRVVSLEVHSSLSLKPYVWSQTVHGTRTFHSSTSLRDVMESLRATFPKTLVLTPFR